MKKNLTVFTYDYPYIGNDSKFMIDEISFLSKKFKNIKLIPIKTSKFKLKLNKNVHIDHGLINEIYNPVNFIFKMFQILKCAHFWKEIYCISKNNFLRKIRMIFTERFLAESLFLFVKKKKNIHGDLFYSFWSNHSLIGFYFLKEKKIINNCFARTLGSDISGFIPNDNYIAFKKIKFKNLNFILTLNDGQKNNLHKQKLINKNLIKKNYLGINIQKKLILNHSKNKISFASCGSLIHVKNNLEIFKFVNYFSKINENYKINYYCIGSGPEKNKILRFVKSNLSKNLRFNFIEYTPSLVNFLKRKKINFFLNFSLSEGMSFAVMEAMSCSIPIICSKISGNTEIINQKRGYILKDLSKKTYEDISKKLINDYKIKKKYYMKRKSNYVFTQKILNREKNLKFLDKIIH